MGDGSLRDRATARRALVALGTLATTLALAAHSPAGAVAGAGVIAAVALAPPPLAVALGQAAVGATFDPALTPTLAVAEAGLVALLLGRTWASGVDGADDAANGRSVDVRSERGVRLRALAVALVAVAAAAVALLAGDGLGLADWHRYALVGAGGATLLYFGHRYEVVLRARAES